MFQAPSQREIEERFIGDDWPFSYTIYNPPEPSSAPATPAPVTPTEPDARWNSNRLNIYQPEPPTALPTIEEHGAACDLTGYQAIGYLIVATGTPHAVTTAIQTPDNQLANGQFKLIVPSTLTVTLRADSFGQQSPPTRLQVVLIDPQGNKVTIDRVPIRVVAP
jgi:hypothetical protein